MLYNKMELFMLGIFLIYSISLLNRPLFNISLARLDIGYQFYYLSKPKSLHWAPNAGYVELGLMDSKIKVGFGTSLFEWPGQISTNFVTMFPVHIYWAPILKPYSFGPKQSASMLLFTLSGSLWADFYSPEDKDYFGKDKYLSLALAYNPGPMVGLKFGYVISIGYMHDETKERSASAFWGGIELKIGGWFSTHEETFEYERPREMRIIEVNEFLIYLKKAIIYDYSPDQSVNQLIERIDSFQKIILKKLKTRERIIKLSAALCSAIAGGGCIYLWWESIAQPDAEACVVGACLILTPLTALGGYGYGYGLGYFYSNFPLSQEEITILNSIIEDYNKLKNQN